MNKKGDWRTIYLERTVDLYKELCIAESQFEDVPGTLYPDELKVGHEPLYNLFS